MNKLLLSLLVVLTTSCMFAQENESMSDMSVVAENVEILFNGDAVEAVEIVKNEVMDEDSASEADNEESRLKLGFEQGYLLLNQDDYDIWDFSHILATRIRKTAEDTYTFDATVRHRDEGWDHYADMFRIVAADEESSVENGERVLLHPHDNEQPFTRSQSRVVATGVVCVEAKDNVHEWGGSSLCIDLTKLDFTNSPINLSWKLLDE